MNKLDRINKNVNIEQNMYKANNTPDIDEVNNAKKQKYMNLIYFDYY